MSLPNNYPWLQWDFDLQVATNRVNGLAGGSKYGLNSNVADTAEDIWQAGGVLQYLDAAETIDVVSSSSDDDGSPPGDGAHTIQIFGVEE